MQTLALNACLKRNKRRQVDDIVEKAKVCIKNEFILRPIPAVNLTGPQKSKVSC